MLLKMAEINVSISTSQLRTANNSSFSALLRYQTDDTFVKEEKFNFDNDIDPVTDKALSTGADIEITENIKEEIKAEIEDGFRIEKTETDNNTAEGASLEYHTEEPNEFGRQNLTTERHNIATAENFKVTSTNRMSNFSDRADTGEQHDNDKSNKENQCRTPFQDSSKIRFQCAVCEKYYCTKNYLKNHIWRYHIRESYECAVCQLKFTNRGRLMDHVRTHRDKKPSQCAVCETRYSPQHSHRDRTSGCSEATPLQCSVCHEKFSKIVLLRMHIRVHTGEKLFWCSACYKNFPTKQGVNSHIATVHTNSKVYPCSICRKELRSKWGLTRHIQAHKARKRFPCPYCDKTFRFKDGLAVHIRYHSSEKPYQCSFCDKQFTAIRSLHVHERMHAREKRHERSLRDKRYSRKDDSNRQVENRENDERREKPKEPFPRANRETQFTEKDCLKEHTMAAHQKRTPSHSPAEKYQRALCDKEFATESAAQSHTNIHVLRKRFSCALCGKRFQEKTEMQLHIKTHTSYVQYARDAKKSYK